MCALLRITGESPTLGAWGLGWEVWLNGMEVTQFTYFQQAGGIECYPVTGELTICRSGSPCICKTLTAFTTWYGRSHRTVAVVTYGDVFLQNENEQSTYNFEHADVRELFASFDHYESEC